MRMLKCLCVKIDAPMLQKVELFMTWNEIFCGFMDFLAIFKTNVKEIILNGKLLFGGREIPSKVLESSKMFIKAYKKYSLKPSHGPS